MMSWKNPKEVEEDRLAIEKLQAHPDVPAHFKAHLSFCLDSSIHPLLEEHGSLIKDPDLLRLAFEMGMNPNVTNSEGFNPLLLLIEKSHAYQKAALVEILVEAGIDVLQTLSLRNALGVKGPARNALQWAERRNQPEVCNVLRSVTEQCLLEKNLAKADQSKKHRQRL